MATNRFEAAARARKVSRLVRHVTNLVSFLGLTPERDGFLISDLLRSWGDKEWTQAGLNVGSPKVGIESRLAVLKHFGEKQRRAS